MRIIIQDSPLGWGFRLIISRSRVNFIPPVAALLILCFPGYVLFELLNRRFSSPAIFFIALFVYLIGCWLLSLSAVYFSLLTLGRGRLGAVKTAPIKPDDVFSFYKYYFIRCLSCCGCAGMLLMLAVPVVYFFTANFYREHSVVSFMVVWLLLLLFSGQVSLFNFGISAGISSESGRAVFISGMVTLGVIVGSAVNWGLIGWALSEARGASKDAEFVQMLLVSVFLSELPAALLFYSKKVVTRKLRRAMGYP